MGPCFFLFFFGCTIIGVTQKGLTHPFLLQLKYTIPYARTAEHVRALYQTFTFSISFYHLTATSQMHLHIGRRSSDVENNACTLG